MAKPNSLNKDLEHVKGCLNVLDVFVRRSECDVAASWLPGVREIDLEAQHRFGLARFARHTIDDETTLVEFVMACGVRYVDRDATAEQLSSNDLGELKKAEIKAEFSAIYQATESVTDEELVLFGKANAGYHVWPYWRELLSSQCARLRVPIAMLPMYTLPSLEELAKSLRLTSEPG